MPTVLILIFTLLIMVTVIPYAFSNVIKQLQAVRLLEQQQEGRWLYFQSDLLAMFDNIQKVLYFYSFL